MKPTNFLFYQEILQNLGSPLILWLSDHGGNKIKNNLMTASFVLEIQGVCIFISLKKYTNHEVLM